jgi:hypothetical protein
MAKPKGFIDAEFEVVDGPVRIGDPHPFLKRWIYWGPDHHGRPLWYRKPRLSKAQFALVSCALVMALWVGAVVALWAFQRLRSY